VQWETGLGRRQRGDPLPASFRNGDVWTIRSIGRFARSPEGKRLMKKALRIARDPKSRRRIAEARGGWRGRRAHAHPAGLGGVPFCMVLVVRASWLPGAAGSYSGGTECFGGEKRAARKLADVTLARGLIRDGKGSRQPTRAVRERVQLAQRAGLSRQRPLKLSISVLS
jgi:hypothetical protein